MGEIKDVVTGLAKEFIEENAAEVAVSFAGMISALGPKEKELAGKIAVIKSTDTGSLDTMSEINEYNELLQEAADLNLEVSDELGEFWTRVATLAKEASTKFVDVSVKVASKALIAAILV